MRLSVNIIITGFLIIISGYIGTLFGNPIWDIKNLFWTSSLILMAVILQIFLNKNESLEKEVKDLSYNISQILIEKSNSNGKVFDVAVNPWANVNIYSNQTYQFEVIINSPIELDEDPSLEIIVDGNCNITCSNVNVVPVKHVNKNRFFIDRRHAIRNLHNKYYVYSLDINFESKGLNKLSLVVENSNFKQEIQNTIKVI